MKKALLASAACAALGLASMAQAAIVTSVINEGVPATTTATLTGYHGLVLHLATDDGANITAVDFIGTGQRGFNGPMGQRWTASNADGNYDTPTPGFSTAKNAASSVQNFDSHFLGTAASFTVGSALNEDAVIGASGTTLAPFPANTDAAGYGLGTKLTGAYGIVGTQQSSGLDVAYLVVPDTGAVHYTAQVATTSGTFDITGVVAVPEPATASLLGFAALGLVARRRRA